MERQHQPGISPAKGSVPLSRTQEPNPYERLDQPPVLKTKGRKGSRTLAGIGNCTNCLLLCLILLFSLSSHAEASNGIDPFESVNRKVFTFNQLLDRVAIKPFASIYVSATPRLLRTGIHNFFGNLADAKTVVHDILQFKFTQASRDFARFGINSTVGIAGLIDVAGPQLGLEKHKEDLGQTLGVWGFGSGPYLMLPVLGPATLRDGIARISNSSLGIANNIDHVPTRQALLATKAIDTRAQLLHFDELLSGDEYLFIREWYLQFREYELKDGAVSDSLANF